jgi:hypothetical protein
MPGRRARSAAMVAALGMLGALGGCAEPGVSAADIAPGWTGQWFVLDPDGFGPDLADMEFPVPVDVPYRRP